MYVLIEFCLILNFTFPIIQNWIFQNRPKSVSSDRFGIELQTVFVLNRVFFYILNFAFSRSILKIGIFKSAEDLEYRIFFEFFKIVFWKF